MALAVALLTASRLPAQREVLLDSTGGRIVFQIAEQIGAATVVPPITVAFWTEGQFGSPPALAVTVTARGTVFTLSDWRVVHPTIGFGMVGPASGSVVLPTSTGSYELVIRHRGIDDRYRLSAERDVIRVVPEAVARVSLTGDTLIRRAIPGTFAVRCHGASSACARLSRELALIPGLQPFELDSTGRNPFGEPITRSSYGRSEPARYFRYSALAQIAAARSVVDRVRDESRGTNPGWAVTLRTWRDPTSWARPADPSAWPRPANEAAPR